jgi:hypothetical protein
VIAASLEMKAQPADKLAAVQAFEREHKTSYPILPVGLPFLKKLHQPEGLPMFLVFDTKGVLVLRQGSASKASVLEALKGVLDK